MFHVEQEGAVESMLWEKRSQECSMWNIAVGFAATMFHVERMRSTFSVPPICDVSAGGKE
jgi:hypothetical protein